MSEVRLIPQKRNVRLTRFQGSARSDCDDWVALEEPLEIRLIVGPDDRRRTRSLSVTMRTPGHDFELASGFLVSEGIITHRGDIRAHSFPGPIPEGAGQANTIELELAPSVAFDIQRLQRHFFTTSSCGICGKVSLEALEAIMPRPIASPQKVDPELIGQLPKLLRERQVIFDQTGGLHAAGLVTLDGELRAIGEDIGRHNAVDKLIGAEFLRGIFPIEDCVMVLSGRASFELIQKALLASIPIVASIGAPSSLAIETARAYGVTLIGFVRPDRFNVYAGDL